MVLSPNSSRANVDAYVDSLNLPPEVLKLTGPGVPGRLLHRKSSSTDDEQSSTGLRASEGGDARGTDGLLATDGRDPLAENVKDRARHERYGYKENLRSGGNAIVKGVAALWSAAVCLGDTSSSASSSSSASASSLSSLSSAAGSSGDSSSSSSSSSSAASSASDAESEDEVPLEREERVVAAVLMSLMRGQKRRRHADADANSLEGDDDDEEDYDFSEEEDDNDDAGAGARRRERGSNAPSTRMKRARIGLYFCSCTGLVLTGVQTGMMGQDGRWRSARGGCTIQQQHGWSSDIPLYSLIPCTLAFSFLARFEFIVLLSDGMEHPRFTTLRVGVRLRQCAYIGSAILSRVHVEPIASSSTQY